MVQFFHPKATWLLGLFLLLILFAPVVQGVDPNFEVGPGQRGEASCASFPQYTYDIFIPTAYSPDGPPVPVIYTISFNENGMVSDFRSACSQLGIIVIGIKSAENGRGWRDYGGEFYAVMRDVRERLNIDPTAQFVGGMSGGAWNSYDMTKLMRPHLTGVFAMGGWLGNQHAETDRYRDGLLVGRSSGIGDTGANRFIEVDKAHLEKYGVQVRDWTFSGGHEESPPSVQVEVFEWMLDTRRAPAENEARDAAAQAATWEKGILAGDVSGVTKECLQTLMDQPGSYFSHRAQEMLDSIFADYEAVRRTEFTDLPGGAYALDYLHYMAWIGLHNSQPEFGWSALHIAKFIPDPGTGLDPDVVALPPQPPLFDFDLPELVSTIGSEIPVSVKDPAEELRYTWSYHGETLGEDSELIGWAPPSGLSQLTLHATHPVSGYTGSWSRYIRVEEDLFVADASGAKESVTTTSIGEVTASTIVARSDGDREVTYELSVPPQIEILSRIEGDNQMRIRYRGLEAGQHTIWIDATDGVANTRWPIIANVHDTVTQTLIAADGPMIYNIPQDDSQSRVWMQPNYLAPEGEEWVEGTNGIGYDTNSTYRRFINTDVFGVMYEKTSSLRVRYSFQVDDPSQVLGLRLAMKYEDGYTVYFNGQPILVRASVPYPTVDMDALYYHSDSLAVLDSVVDLSPHRDKLVSGQNIFAVHALNNEPESSDFLLAPVLEARIILQPPSPLEDAAIAWATETRPEGSDGATSPDADPDHDGSTNLDEFLLGGDAWNARTAPQLVFNYPDSLEFRGLPSDLARSLGVEYVIAHSSFLTNFQPESEERIRQKDIQSTPGTHWIYRYELTPPVERRGFYRVVARFQD